MTIKIPANATKLELDKSKKTFDTSKYIGKIKFSGDSVEFQRDLR